MPVALVERRMMIDSVVIALVACAVSVGFNLYQAKDYGDRVEEIKQLKDRNRELIRENVTLESRLLLLEREGTSRNLRRAPEIRDTERGRTPIMEMGMEVPTGWITAEHLIPESEWPNFSPSTRGGRNLYPTEKEKVKEILDPGFWK